MTVLVVRRGAVRCSVTQQHDRSREALRLLPFRGMRYNSEVVGGVAAVTSPPYDVMDRPMIDALLQQHPCNIVRLILPRMVSDPMSGGNPYELAAKRLERWRARGVLLTDDAPGLYVYEYGDATHAVCGLVGSVELRRPEQRVILPHEDVIAGIVADRLAMMTASHANLEPILLVYDGAGETAPIIDAARARVPLTDVLAPDGTFHRLWAVTAPDELATLTDALAAHQALIADGHHRYATYLQLHELLAAATPGTPFGRGDPSATGLALLIDQSRWPLQLSAIHRSVAELGLSSLVAPDGFEISSDVSSSTEAALPSTKGALVLTDGLRRRTIRLRTRPTAGSSDAQLLHDVLLPYWAVTDDRVGYHHTVEQALRTAHQDGGIAVLLHPATVREVMAVAREGKIMPRKSTSFGPKPRMGLVMRSFDDEPPVEPLGAP